MDTTGELVSNTMVAPGDIQMIIVGDLPLEIVEELQIYTLLRQLVLQELLQLIKHSESGVPVHYFNMTEIIFGTQVTTVLGLG